MRNNKINILIISLLFIASLLWGILNFQPLLYLGGDNATYIILGRSLLEGHFMYEKIGSDFVLHSHFPPLYPLILGILMFLFGKENIFALKTFSLLTYVFFIILTYFTALKYKNTKISAVLISVYFMILYESALWSSRILTEMPFAFVITAILFLFADIEKSENIRKISLFLFIVILSVYLKSISFYIIILPFFLYVLFKKRYSLIKYIIPAAILSSLWDLRNMLLGSSDNYFSQIVYIDWYKKYLGYASVSDILQRINYNSIDYFMNILPTIFFPATKNNAVIFTIASLISTFVLISAIIYLIRTKRIFEISVLVFNFLILLVWPKEWSDSRFLFPLLFIIISSYINFAVNDKHEKYYVKIIMISFVILSLSYNYFYQIPLIKKNYALLKKSSFNVKKDANMYNEPFNGYFKMAIWCDSFLPENVIIMTRKPSLFQLFSDRSCIIYPFEKNADTIKQYIIKNNVDYIAKSDYLASAVYFRGFLNKHCEIVKEIYADSLKINSVLKILR